MNDNALNRQQPRIIYGLYVFLFIFLMFGCQGAYSLLSELLMSNISGTSMQGLISGGDAAELDKHVGLIKVFQSGYSLFSFLVPAFIMMLLLRQPLSTGLSMSKPPRWVLLPLVAGIMLSALPFVNLTYVLNSNLPLPDAIQRLVDALKPLEEATEKLTMAFLTMDNVGELLINLLVIAAIPALAEEFCFRGVMQKLFHRWFGNIHAAVIVTGLVFALIHVQFEGILPRWVLGIILGYLFFWSGNIWYPVIAHFVYNGVQVVAAYFQPEMLESDTTQQPVTLATALMVLAFTVMLFFLLSVFRKQTEVTPQTPL